MSKKDIVKYIIDEYSVTSPTDITNALKDLLGETLQEMLNAEFDEHMGYKKYDQTAGKTNYRNAAFEPVVVEKHTRDICDVDNKIINLYARGMSTKDISDTVKDIYGIEVNQLHN